MPCITKNNRDKENRGKKRQTTTTFAVNEEKYSHNSLLCCDKKRPDIIISYNFDIMSCQSLRQIFIAYMCGMAFLNNTNERLAGMKPWRWLLTTAHILFLLYKKNKNLRKIWWKLSNYPFMIFLTCNIFLFFFWFSLMV